MLKKFLYNLVGGGLLVFVLVQTINDRSYLAEDMTFIIGTVMLSVGLMTISGATKMFRGMGYVLRKMFTKKVEGLSYYEYLLMKEDKTERVMGYPLFFAGIVYVILSFYVEDLIVSFWDIWHQLF
ncbi:MAG TPA: DUF3899 domain-containing protein [Candidatus Izemoplasmatales bacterium]|nr:DUF3899 domain-containing protein [Candidatus Izemoplasmatales bacterium]